MQDELKPIVLDPDDLAERYARVCNALCRAMWADRYGIREDDGLMHTSDEARRVTNAVFEALLIVPSDGGASMMEWMVEHADGIRAYTERRHTRS